MRSGATRRATTSMSSSPSRYCVTVVPDSEPCSAVWISRERDAELARLVLVDVDAHALQALAPVLVDAPHVRVGAQDRGHLVGDRLHLPVVLAEHAELHRIADRRPVLEPVDAAAHEREVVVEQLLDLRQHALARLAALGHHHQLAEVEVRRLHVERQVEARAAVADVAGDGDDVGIVLQLALRAPATSRWLASKVAACGSHRSTISSGRSEAGKNCLRHDAEQRERADERRDRDADDPACGAPGRRRRGGGTARRSRAGRPRPRRRARRRGARFSSLKPMYGVNSTATIHDSISEMPTTWNSENTYSPEPDFAKPDRQEAGRGDQRAGEHRERGRGVGVGRGAEPVPALLELQRHHLDGDDRVVDQQAERDDQRAERDALQLDARGSTSTRNVSASTSGMHSATTRPVRMPSEKKLTTQHDGHRLEQALLELVHRLLDDARLVGHRVDLARRPAGSPGCARRSR